MPEDEPKWRLDKHIPIALLLAILGQGAFVVSWGSKMEIRMATAEAEAASRWQAADNRLTRIEADSQDRAVRFATLNAQLEALKDTVSEVKDGQREQTQILRQLSGERLKP